MENSKINTIPFLGKLKKETILNTLIITFLYVINLMPIIIGKSSVIIFFISSFIWLISCIFLNFQNAFNISIFVTIAEIFNASLYPISFTAMIASIFAAVFIVKHIYFTIKEKTTINIYLIIISSILALYGVFNLNVKNVSPVFSNVIILIIMYLAYNNLDKKETAIYYILGMILNITIGICLFLFSETKNIVLYGENRFMALCVNPNQLQLLCVLAIAILITFNFKKQINVFVFAFCIVFFVVTGIFTLSKTFFLCLILMTIIYLVFSILNNLKNGIITTMVMLLFALSISFLLKDEIFSIISRFKEINYKNIIDTILTGRLSIWQTYMSEWKSNKSIMFFGKGVSALPAVDIGSHSIYVDLIYRFGIIGIVLWLCLISLYFYLNVKTKKINIKYMLPFMMYLTLGIVEEIFYTKYLFLIILCFELLFENEKCDMKEEKKYAEQ